MQDILVLQDARELCYHVTYFYVNMQHNYVKKEHTSLAMLTLLSRMSRNQ